MIEKIRNNPRLKQFVIGLISPHRHPRPRLWVRWFVNPFVHKKGRGAFHLEVTQVGDDGNL